MWVRLFSITFIFYFLGLLSNNFFVHFAAWGARPNFIFIFFFILIFFSEENSILSFEDLFYCFVAGFFADMFSFSSFGMSFLLFLALSVAFKKVFNSLKQKKDRHPFAYFIPLFLAFFIAYNSILTAYLYFLPYSKTISAGPDIFSFVFLIKIIYNLIFAALGFYFYKIFSKKKSSHEF